MPAKKSTTETVRVKADIAKMIRVICAVDDIYTAEYLDGKLRPAIERDRTLAAKKLAKERGIKGSSDSGH